MKLDEAPASVRSLLDASAPAVVVIRRPDGEPEVSPIWFRRDGDAIEFVVAIGDRKLAMLRHDPRCVVMVFEASPPFRGIRAEGTAELADDSGAATRLAIASRYLGQEAGARYASLDRRPPGVVVRLSLADAVAWDLADKIA